MEDTQAYSWVIFKARQKNRELERRWGEEMPNMAKGEYEVNKKVIQWAQEKIGALHDERS